MALYAFDGTWNAQKDGSEYGLNTNVVEFARAYDGRRDGVQKEGEKGEPTVDDDFYRSGVGTRFGIVGKVFGGALGFGGHFRIAEAKRSVAKHFAEGDEVIDIVGFSRGAALALHFTNALKGASFKNRNGVNTPAKVRFLGLWDVVAAFGIPLDLGPLRFNRVNLGYRLTLGDHVEYCFHAISIDEQRKSFRVTRVDNGYQVWFRGCHSDIGGGNGNAKLSNISLAWMLRKAGGAGLPVDTGLPERLTFDKAANVVPGKGVTREFRKIQKNDRIHHTVEPRQVAGCQNPPDGCAVESPADEANRILTVAQLAEEASRAD
jgi:uncharacterized protein (DUF2235 family)